MSLVHSKDELLERKKRVAKVYVLGDTTMVLTVSLPLEPGPTPTSTAYVASHKVDT